MGAAFSPDAVQVPDLLSRITGILQCCGGRATVSKEDFESTVGVMVDKLENGEASQIGDMLEDYSDEDVALIWLEVRRRMGR